MLSVVCGALALNARGAVLTSSASSRAPAASMITPLEAGWVYTPPTPLGKALGMQALDGSEAATGNIVPTSAASAAPLMEAAHPRSFLYSPPAPLGKALGCQAIGGCTVGDEEVAPEGPKAKMVEAPLMEAAHPRSFLYSPPAPLGKALGMSLDGN